MKKILFTLLISGFLIFPPVLFAKGPVTVSSKIDTEGSLLGNIMKYVLIENGFEVKDKIQLGSTNIMRKAIKNDQIDVYAEYTGNGPFFFDIKDKSVFKDFKKGYETVKKLDYEQNRLVWLTPADVSNGWAIAGRKEFCKKHGIETMEDFAKLVRNTDKVKLAASEEFVNRFDALPAFQEAYNFKLEPSQLVILSGGNTAMTEKAAARNTSGVNFSMAYGTDGALSALGLKVLEDTKSVQPVYAPCPVIRKEVLDKYPEIASILEKVFKDFDLETLQELNSKIAVMGYPASKVAKEYLADKDY